MVAYAAVDLACLALEWASAPNFRPTFQLFSWHTCLLGIVSCLVMMFLISPAGASGSLGLMLLLLGFIHLRSAASSWGYISQALISTRSGSTCCCSTSGRTTSSSGGRRSC
uniref:Solute carrier family 12 member 9 n=1 Tax=Micrurus corallinus TaxID=54390 RepID=A0A2D4GAU9_MICCO